MKLDAMYTTTLSMRVVVQRDFSINSPSRLYAGVEKVSTYCEGCSYSWWSWCSAGIQKLVALKNFRQAEKEVGSLYMVTDGKEEVG